jgi:hypothetical protein
LNPLLACCSLGRRRLLPRALTAPNGCALFRSVSTWTPPQTAAGKKRIQEKPAVRRHRWIELTKAKTLMTTTVKIWTVECYRRISYARDGLFFYYYGSLLLPHGVPARGGDRRAPCTSHVPRGSAGGIDTVCVPNHLSTARQRAAVRSHQRRDRAVRKAADRAGVRPRRAGGAPPVLLPGRRRGRAGLPRRAIPGSRGCR